MRVDQGNLDPIVKRFRLDKGFTQDDLAEKIGLGTRQIAAIENEGSKPRYGHLELLIQVLDIPADMIFRPEAMVRTPEQEQFLREMLSCSEYERRVLRSLLQALRHNESK